MLLNSWTGNANSTGPARAKTAGASVYLSGGISTSGSNMAPFILPPGFRPDATINVPVDLFGGLKGSLQITAAGIVVVQSSGSLSNAQSTTSLDGVSFQQSTVNANLTLQQLPNIWR